MISLDLKTLVRQPLLLLLTIYSNYLSCFLPSSCRFYPSCSHYSHEAIKEHGVVRGIFMTTKRLLRCHPWDEGGYDPVPTRGLTEFTKTPLYEAAQNKCECFKTKPL